MNIRERSIPTPLILMMIDSSVGPFNIFNSKHPRVEMNNKEI